MHGYILVFVYGYVVRRLVIIIIIIIIIIILKIDQYSLIEQSLVLLVTAILECITIRIFELDLATQMTRRKSDPFDPDMRIDLTQFQPWF